MDETYNNYGSPFREGELISCIIDSVIISNGKIHFENDSVYICQDKISGLNCKNKLGYQYSWVVSGREACNQTWEAGCIDNKVSDCKIITRNPFKVGNIVQIVSNTNNMSGRVIGYVFSIAEISRCGDYCREAIKTSKGVHYSSLKLIEDLSDALYYHEPEPIIPHGKLYATGIGIGSKSMIPTPEAYLTGIKTESGPMISIRKSIEKEKYFKEEKILSLEELLLNVQK